MVGQFYTGTDIPMAIIKWVFEPNWTQEAGYYCDYAYLRTFGKQISILSDTLICVLLTAVVDFIGRKRAILTMSIFTIVFPILAYFLPYMIGKEVLISSAFGVMAASSGIYAIVLEECTLPKTKIKSMAITCGLVAYGLGCVSVNLVAYVAKSSN